MWLLDGQTHSSLWTDQDWSKPLWIFNRCNFSKVKYGSALRDDIRVIWNFWNSNLVWYYYHQIGMMATNWNLVTVRFSLTTTKVKMRANLGWSLVVSVKILRKKNLEALFLFLKNCFAIQSSRQQSISHILSPLNSFFFNLPTTIPELF